MKMEGASPLIADNDEAVLLELERALGDEGYDTAVTVSREAAFQVLSTGAFDLLVIDDYFSDQHCVQVLTHFRGAGIRPMVVVTCHRFPSYADREQRRSLGVSTPVDKRVPIELLRTVHYLLRSPERCSPQFDIT
jgi:CheY-like chemotaxis protein